MRKALMALVIGSMALTAWADTREDGYVSSHGDNSSNISTNGRFNNHYTGGDRPDNWDRMDEYPSSNRYGRDYSGGDRSDRWREREKVTPSSTNPSSTTNTDSINNSNSNTNRSNTSDDQFTTPR